jgi:hypothetical protein
MYSRQIGYVRSFSTTKPSNSVLDYFKFFKKKNSQDANIPQPKDTEEVIKDVESNQENITKNTKIEILGRKNPRYTDKEIIKQNLNGFQVHRWIPKSNFFTETLTPENYKSKISEQLTTLFNDSKISIDSSIDNLYIRFDILKKIQKLFTISIPDSKFTYLSDFSNIESYLITNLNPTLKLSNKNEFQPDAIDFNPNEFLGTNVSVSKHVFKSEKERTYKSLLKKASALEKKTLLDYAEKENSQSTSNV